MTSVGHRAITTGGGRRGVENDKCPQGWTVEVISIGFFFFFACGGSSATQSLLVLSSAYSQVLTPLSHLPIKASRGGRAECSVGKTD